MAVSTDRVVELGNIRRLTESFEVSLRARNLSERTVKTYLEGIRLFTAFLEKAGMPTEVSAITREHVEAFMAQELERVSPSSVHIRYRALQQFFRWAMEDGEVPVSPMVNMRPPLVPEQPVPVIAEEQLAMVLKACNGSRFEDRRDLAIIRFLLDTGVRRSELVRVFPDLPNGPFLQGHSAHPPPIARARERAWPRRPSTLSMADSYGRVRRCASGTNQQRGGPCPATVSVPVPPRHLDPPLKAP